MTRMPYTYIEIDVDYAGPVKTLRVGPPVTGVPVGWLAFPCLSDISLRSGSVNIGGMDDRLSAFGERAELSFTVFDFPYHDRFWASYEATPVVSGGTFWPRLLARWSAFSGAAVRVVEAYIDGGAIASQVVKNYILRDVRRNGRGTYTWTALDPLDLAANDNALAPKPSSGVLFDDISAVAGTLTLSPTGIGDEEYPASGRATIGSEYVEFTRSGDVLTLTQRGFKGTTAAAHQSGDTVQVALFYEGAPLDVAGADLLTNFAGLAPALIPSVAWAAERERWAFTRKITTDIVKPTPVDEIMGEISLLGCSFWWDDVSQTVGFKTIRPPDSDTVHVLTEDDVKEFGVDFRDEDRITRIMFSSIQKTPLDNPKSYDSYQRHSLIVDADAEALFKGPRQLEINCRMLNQGADVLVRQISRRFLKRRARAPKIYRLVLDAKDRAIGLTDIIEFTTREIQDIDGNPVPVRMQVIKRTEVRNGHDFEVLAQEYDYFGRLAYIAPTGAPSFAGASDAQKAAYAFLADATTGLMPDGSPAYEII